MTHKINPVTISRIADDKESQALDRLLWEMLWKPLGLSRNVRDSFALAGEAIELVAKQNDMIVGGLVAYRISERHVELRHIAVYPDYQNTGTASRLINELVEIVRRENVAEICTVARNTSADFFKKLGFCAISEKPLEHPDFEKYGIYFVEMKKNIRQ